MTYSVKFETEQFQSDLAWTSEHFQLSGSRKIRVKEIEKDRFVGACDEVRRYVARSTQPFVVTVSRRAGGGNVHLNGELRIYVAAHREGIVDHTVDVQYAKA